MVNFHRDVSAPAAITIIRLLPAGIITMGANSNSISLTQVIFLAVLVSSIVGCLSGVATFLALSSGAQQQPQPLFKLHKAKLFTGPVEQAANSPQHSLPPKQGLLIDSQATDQAGQPRSQAASVQADKSTGFYVTPGEGDFYKLAKTANTDKVSTHNYEVLYDKYFSLGQGKPKVKKILEIGLGCDMVYGPGASAKVWRELLPEAEVWFAEFNEECVKANQDKMDKANIKVVVGDQSKVDTLRRWIKETGGDFDVIVDDGGHLSEQQIPSFMMLFQHALKPGGLYIIEDLIYWRGNSDHPTTTDLIHDWIEAMMGYNWEQHPINGTRTQIKMPPGLRSIECMLEACAFIKCYDNDRRCNKGSALDHEAANKWTLQP